MWMKSLTFCCDDFFGGKSFEGIAKGYHKIITIIKIIMRLMMVIIKI